MTMPSDPRNDPVHVALSRLPSLQPREFHVHQVRRRCLTALARQRRAARRQGAREGAIDVLMASAVVVYVVLSVAQAVQLASGL